MVYKIKEMVDGQEEIIYTRAYDDLEREYYELYLEEQGIDEDEYEEEGGDISDLWDEFFESNLYKELLEIAGEGEVQCIH
ncbi:hypothetical protein ACLHDG_01825 [Sulfurovum sp. CS9]|uniref:hypothetical protein n=1 Tax=Sulfurovum sp. CS9 TaxID=3391146 RepID=UPI0039EBB273